MVYAHNYRPLSTPSSKSCGESKLSVVPWPMLQYADMSVHFHLLREYLLPPQSKFGRFRGCQRMLRNAGASFSCYSFYWSKHQLQLLRKLHRYSSQLFGGLNLVATWRRKHCRSPQQYSTKISPKSPKLATLKSHSAISKSLSPAAGAQMSNPAAASFKTYSISYTSSSSCPRPTNCFIHSPPPFPPAHSYKYPRKQYYL